MRVVGGGGGIGRSQERFMYESVCNVCAHVYVLVRVRLCARAHVSVYVSSRARACIC